MGADASKLLPKSAPTAALNAVKVANANAIIAVKAANANAVSAVNAANANAVNAVKAVANGTELLEVVTLAGGKRKNRASRKSRNGRKRNTRKAY